MLFVCSTCWFGRVCVCQILTTEVASAVKLEWLRMRGALGLKNTGIFHEDTNCTLHSLSHHQLFFVYHFPGLRPAPMSVSYGNCADRTFPSLEVVKIRCTIRLHLLQFVPVQ